MAPRAAPRPEAPCSWARGWRGPLRSAAGACSPPAPPPLPPDWAPVPAVLPQRGAFPTQKGAGGTWGGRELGLVPELWAGLCGGDNRNPALTAHLLLQPVPEHGHAGVDPWLPWLPASVPPGGDSIQDLSGAGVRLRTGEGASRVALQGPEPRERALHRPLAPTPLGSLTPAGLGSSDSTGVTTLVPISATRI